MYEESFKFYDPALPKAIDDGDQDTHAFFRLLAICHTVMPEEKDGEFPIPPTTQIHFAAVYRLNLF